MLQLAFAAALCAPSDRAILAEILYDPAGDDTGHEFVELYSPATAPVSLTGLRLEAGDGSGPGRWTLKWTGGAGDAIAPGARFVIGGSKLAPAPNATATLDLQNGPDAVRLVWPDGATEVVGWGAHEFAEYSCGEPAPDVASGSSLARTPDDAATGANATDFRAAIPSPGRANVSLRNVGVVPGSLVLDPEQPDPGAPVTARAGLLNLGRDALEAGAVGWSALADGGYLGGARSIATLAAGETLLVEVPFVAPAAGKLVLELIAALAGDENAVDDTLRASFRVGAGPLEITEIQFHPAAGEGEWVEVRNRSGVTLDLSGFTLADRADHGGAIPSALLPADSLVVLVQDAAALLGMFPALDASRVVEVGAWSALNNSNDDAGVADIVRLRETDGVPCTHVAYSAAGVPAGVTIERDEFGSWSPSLAAHGTPLGPPLARSSLVGSLEIVPRRMSSGANARLEWSVPWPARISIAVYDLEGSKVMDAMMEAEVAPRGERGWNARLPPGLYVAALTASPLKSGAPIVATRAFRIEGSR